MALRLFIGKICHVYLDNIIIWLNLVAEHLWNVEIILEVLRKHKMFCSPKKTDLFCTSLQFLGRIISANGIQADPTKIQMILDWPVPKSAMDVHSFLGLVHYLATFLLKLANYMSVLTLLTTKESKGIFPK